MNLHLRTIIIVYMLKLTIFNCENLFIEPKISRTFLNIPMFPCHEYGIHFQDFHESIAKVSNFGRNNENIEVETFYNPELFGDRGPEKMGQLSYVYLQYDDISQKVDEHFCGIGVLNYTAWNPIFRQNHGRLEYYYNHSILNEKKIYPLLNDNQTIELAKLRFECSSKTVLTKTLAKLKNLWSQATWGFLDYPKCYSLSKKGITVNCDKDVMEDNDRLSWLWNFKIALFPSLFIPSDLTTEGLRNYIGARLNEAKRIAEKYEPPLIIIPYLSLNYEDDPDNFLNSVKLYFAIEEIKRKNVSNNIIFKVNDKNLKSKEQCENYVQYLNTHLAPAIVYSLNNVQN